MVAMEELNVIILVPEATCNVAIVFLQFSAYLAVHRMPGSTCTREEQQRISGLSSEVVSEFVTATKCKLIIL